MACLLPIVLKQFKKEGWLSGLKQKFTKLPKRKFPGVRIPLLPPLYKINKYIFYAEVAQLVEHHLAKVDVEGSSPFFRSIFGRVA